MHRAQRVVLGQEPTRPLSDQATVTRRPAVARAWVNGSNEGILRGARSFGVPSEVETALFIAGDAITGVPSILFDRPRTFTTDDKLLASWLADYVAITVRVAQLYDERRRSDMQSTVFSHTAPELPPMLDISRSSNSGALTFA